MKKLYVELLTPTSELFKGNVKSLSVPGEKSPFQVLFNHAPILSTLTEGKIKIIDEDDNIKSFEIESGTIEVLKNKVSLLVKTK